MLLEPLAVQGSVLNTAAGEVATVILEAQGALVVVLSMAEEEAVAEPMTLGLRVDAEASGELMA